MAYYTKVLLPDEKLLHVGKLHWVIYLKAWFFLVADLAALITFLMTRNPGQPLMPSSDQPAQPALAYISGGIFVVLLVVWVLQLVAAWSRRATTEIVVTDKRVLFKEGFIRRRTIEMNMNKVETVDVQQSIGGRLLNYGTVLIRGTGSSYEPLRLVDSPLALRTAIVAQ
jgi:uncharacterized membrane protein YdbT with pleckstrin-like domain